MRSVRGRVKTLCAGDMWQWWRDDSAEPFQRSGHYVCYRGMDDRSAIRSAQRNFPTDTDGAGQLLRHRRVWLAGGYGSDGAPLSSMEIYCHTVPTTERASADDAYSDIYSDPDRYIAPAHANSNRRI